jgi:hypothetical protein
MPGAWRDRQDDIIGFEPLAIRATHRRFFIPQDDLTNHRVEPQTPFSQNARELGRESLISAAAAINFTLRPVFFETAAFDLAEISEVTLP